MLLRVNIINLESSCWSSC